MWVIRRQYKMNEKEKNEKYKEQIENYKRILSKKVGKSYEIITQILEV